MMMLTEDVCPHCRKSVHVELDSTDLYSHKKGRVRCGCGHVVNPCTECGNYDDEGHYVDCVECPWKDSAIDDAMTDDEKEKWMNEHFLTTVEINDGTKDVSIENMKTLGYSLYDITDNRIVFKNENSSTDSYDELLQFHRFADVVEFCNKYKIVR